MTRTHLMRHQGWFVAGVLFLALATGGAGTALGQQAPSAPTQPPRRQQLLTPEDRAAMAQVYWLRIQERLGLTDQQVSDIRAILQARRDATRADIRTLFAARRELRSLLQQPNSDPAAIQSAAGQVKQLQDKMFDQHLQTQLAIRSKLTPDQLAKWGELHKGMGGHGWRRGGGFGWQRS
jgi:Spy/CpxP family protein refolding chaperone